jgi:hypothetical protein
MKHGVLQRRGSTAKTLIIVFSIIGGFVFLAILACAGFMFWGIKTIGGDMAGAQATADQFVNEIRAGHIDAAYAGTTNNFQAIKTSDQFREFVKQYPALTTYTSRTSGGVFINKTPGLTTATARVTVLGPGNSLSFTLILNKQNESWKVDQFNVP